MYVIQVAPAITQFGRFLDSGYLTPGTHVLNETRNTAPARHRYAVC